jgi:hypothetical protein
MTATTCSHRAGADRRPSYQSYFYEELNAVIQYEPADSFDPSYTMWFGPTAPQDHEGNWIQTMPNKSYNVLLRLYGPLQPWFGKTWKPGDFELVP